MKLRESENMKGIVSNYGQVRQSKFQTEQEVSGSISPPEIKTANCQNKDGLRLMACQDVFVAVHSQRWRMDQARST